MGRSMVVTNQTGTTMRTFCIDMEVERFYRLSAKELLEMELDFQKRLEAEGFSVVKTYSEYSDNHLCTRYWAIAIVEQNIEPPSWCWVKVQKEDSHV